MSDQPLVSVIMPAYNAEQYISEAIQSVLDQDYSNFELLIINDGSIDSTESIILSFSDTRIRYFQQDNRGVSAARNVGLDNMKGEYFCFLDADDLMTECSISSRLSVLLSAESKYCFSAGGQITFKDNPSNALKVSQSNYNGNPRKGLISLNSNCFINCGTWMVKTDHKQKYQFIVGLTHCEDMVFFLSISSQGEMVSVDKVSQYYRQSLNSAMSNLKALEAGYWYFRRFAKERGYIRSLTELIILTVRIRKIMCLTYYSQGQYINAFRVLFF